MEERILTRYLRGEASPEETEQVLLWVEASEDNLAELNFLRTTYEASLYGLKPSSAPRLERPGTRTRARRNHRFGWAAAVAAVAVLSFAVYLPFGTKVDSDISVQRVCSPLGQQMEVILSDGTVVWLNSNSELEFSDLGSRGVRRVSLKGEAYFEVARNERRPFIVSTPGFNVKVLGTKFNVNTYYEKQSVVLVEGAVDVQYEKETYSLKPGNLFYYDASNGDRAITKVDPGNYVAWTNGYLEFSSNSLEHVLSQIQSFFGASFEYDSKKAASTFLSGKLELRDGLVKALDGLKNTSAINYSMRDSSSVSINIL